MIYRGVKMQADEGKKKGRPAALIAVVIMLGTAAVAAALAVWNMVRVM